MKFFLSLSMNALTVAALYFLVASGFSLVFGLLRSVNMAHGALYLLGGYVGYEIANFSGSWLLGCLCAAAMVGGVGICMHFFLMRPLGGDELRQALVSIGMAVVIGDLMLARYGGGTYQFEPPDVIFGSTPFPIIGAYPTIRLFVIAVAVAVGFLLWYLIHRTRLGMLIRAGVDDSAIVSAMGFNIDRTMTVVFGLGAALAGLAGVVGGARCPYPRERTLATSCLLLL